MKNCQIFLYFDIIRRVARKREMTKMSCGKKECYNKKSLEEEEYFNRKSSEAGLRSSAIIVCSYCL
jgi:hypothetical protein